jgi:flagellar assembly protein FliH
MASTRKFLFDTSFDSDLVRRREEALATPPPPPPPPLEPEPPPAEPTFSQAELLQAHEDGYADGFANGKAQAEAAVNTRLAAILEQLGGQLEQLLSDVLAMADHRRDETIRIGLTIAQKLLPDFARREGLAEIEAMIATCVAELFDEPRLVIRVNDADLDAVAAQIGDLTTARGFDGKVVLLAEKTVAPGDCRIEWADGGAERDSARLWQDIEKAAGRLLGATTAPKEAHGHSAGKPSTVIES